MTTKTYGSFITRATPQQKRTIAMVVVEAHRRNPKKLLVQHNCSVVVTQLVKALARVKGRGRVIEVVRTQMVAPNAQSLLVKVQCRDKVIALDHDATQVV